MPLGLLANCQKSGGKRCAVVEFVSNLPEEGSVIITKNGRPCAVLMPITEDTDLEIVALSQNKRFWKLFDAAHERAEREGWTRLEDLEP